MNTYKYDDVPPPFLPHFCQIPLVLVNDRYEEQKESGREGGTEEASRRFSRRSDTSMFKKRLCVGKEREWGKGEGGGGGERKREAAKAESVCLTQ